MSIELREQAVDEVVREVRDMRPGENPLLEELLLEDAVVLQGKLGEGAVDLAQTLLARVEAMPAGFDGLVIAEPTCAPRDLMRAIYRQGLDFERGRCDVEETRKARAGVHRCARNGVGVH